jgi:hypothetical protein
MEVYLSVTNEASLSGCLTARLGSASGRSLRLRLPQAASVGLTASDSLGESEFSETLHIGESRL